MLSVLLLTSHAAITGPLSGPEQLLPPTVSPSNAIEGGADAEAAPFWCANLPANVHKLIPACANAAALELEHGRGGGGGKTKAVAETDSDEAIRVEVKAVVRDRGYQGTKQHSRFHKGGKSKNDAEAESQEAVRIEVKAVVRDRGYQSTKVHRHHARATAAIEAAPAWCATIPAEARKFIAACANTALEMLSAGKDECLSDSDALLDAIDDNMDKCADESGTYEEIDACMTKLGYSTGCSACVGDFYKCWDDKCSKECGDAGSEDACDKCLDAKCEPTFDTCSGLESPALLALRAAGPSGEAFRPFHAKSKNIAEAESQDAVRIEVKAVVRDRGYQGTKQVHRHPRVTEAEMMLSANKDECLSDSDALLDAIDDNMDKCADESGTYEEIDACMTKLGYSTGCSACVGDFYKCWDDKCSKECGDAGSEDACDKCLDAKCEPTFDTCSGLESPALLALRSAGPARRFHAKSKNVAEAESQDAVRIEVKAVVRDRGYQSTQVHRHHARASATGNSLEAAEACAAYCTSTPRLSQKYDPNCAACPGAGIAPAVSATCAAGCGWTPSTSWQYVPGCTGCK